jgi:hypothetical protein
MKKLEENIENRLLLDACSFDKDSQEGYEDSCAGDHDAFSYLPENWFRNTFVLWHLAVHSEYHHEGSCERYYQAKHIQALDTQEMPSLS